MTRIAAQQEALQMRPHHTGLGIAVTRLMPTMIVALAVVTGCGSATAATATTPTQTTDSSSTAQTRDDQAYPLVGDWRSRRLSISKARAAVVAAGYSMAEFDAFWRSVGSPRAWEFDLTFYDEGGVPYVLKTGWDPSTGSMPADGDHGPYKLQAGHRVLFTSIDHPEEGVLFSYRLRGGDLTLHEIRETPRLTPRQLRANNLLWASVSPLTKVS